MSHAPIASGPATTRRLVLTFAACCVLAAAYPAAAQDKPFEPQVGQAGKDVVWVPTSEALVEKMLDMAKVMPSDYVVDLGSGDGRNVIAAAKRGARARGFEYNADMVALSNRLAREAGVADKATFVQGDMFEAHFSDANVLALFLLPVNFERLRDKFLDLKPGSRIVVNTFGIGGSWEPVETERIESDCTSWCVAMLYIVPAKVAGTWRFEAGDLSLTQDVQTIKGSLMVKRDNENVPISGPRLRGDQINFRVGTTEYTGRVIGDRIEGTAVTDDKSESWIAMRLQK
jgi:SAM-dependent methyltransferase